MEKIPIVSVLMTSFNREKYIADAIQSVLSSTYKNFELIIVDDNSSDNTVKIAKDFAEKDARIKLHVNECNLGDYANRNKAAEFAKGKYIKYLDSDDLIYPWGIEAMCFCMEKFPNAGLGLMTYNFYVKKAYPICLTPYQAFCNFFFKGRLISMGPTGAIINREAFEAVGGFSGRRYVGDTELWYKLSSKFNVVCMPSELVWWREHLGQEIQEERKNIEVQYIRYLETQAALNDKECPLNNSEIKMALQNAQNLYCRNIIIAFFKGNFKLSLMLFRLANLSVLKVLLSLRRNKYPSDLDEKLISTFIDELK